MKASTVFAQTIPRVSRLDNLRFAAGFLLTDWLQGLFTRNPFWVGVVAALHPDPLGVRLIAGLRRKYGSSYLFLTVAKTPTLLVLAHDAIRHVLERSPAVYADPAPKRQGMSRFQPDAVTISRGEAWRDRRRFNEAVLGFPQHVHANAGIFLRIIDDECRSILPAGSRSLEWRHIERLFERIMLGVIFGRMARDDLYLVRALHALMQNANLSAILPPKKKLLADFDTVVQSYVKWPHPGSLAALCQTAPASEMTRVAGQIPHWMFAMNETLGANVARALALIAATPQVQQQVLAELSSVRLDSPHDIDGATFLGGCLQEAMRLWPTTPMLIRELVSPDSLGGEDLPAGTRVLIPTSFLHRDLETCDTGNEFRPQRWIETPDDDRFHHLSNGTQVCAGKPLALFLGKAVLAALLKGRRFDLARPALPSRPPLPGAYDYFRLQLAVQSRTV
jgi:cytochrome P450